MHCSALCPAASFLGGLMRMSASMCLVLMEMTGAPNTLPFLMMVLIISKGVGDRFNYRCVQRGSENWGHALDCSLQSERMCDGSTRWHAAATPTYKPITRASNVAAAGPACPAQPVLCQQSRLTLSW